MLALIAPIALGGRLFSEPPAAAEGPRPASASAREHLLRFVTEYETTSDGELRCDRLYALLDCTPPFSREDVEKTYREAMESGGIGGVVGILKFGTFEQRLELLASKDPCVREYLFGKVSSDLERRAKEEGREADLGTDATIRGVVAAHNPQLELPFFLDPRRVRLWRDLAIVEATFASEGHVYLVRRAGEGWEYVGGRMVWIA